MSEDLIHVDHVIPIFNKNVFSSNGAVVVTNAARMVMAKNHRRTRQNPPSKQQQGAAGDSKVNQLTTVDNELQQLTKAELHAIRCVVDGLRLIHRGRLHIKEVLSHCITEETYGPNEYVDKKDWEHQLSCHYIMSGSVMVTYELDKEVMEKEKTSTVNETTEIVYTHGAGEYLAMLSLEGIEDDIAPPSTVFTLERTEFLRIDRVDFHERLNRMMSKLRQEIRDVLQHPDCILSAVPDEAMERILPHITRQHYPPQQVILRQGDESNVMFCMAKGRCKLSRVVNVPEARKDVCFYMGFVEQYGCFGQECLLQSSPSLCTATTTCPVLVLKINRQALQVVIKDHLHTILDRHFNGYTPDLELQQTGYHACVWNEFKHSQVKQHLLEVGALGVMLPRKSGGIKRRPMSPEERYKENLRRFSLHGAHFEPVTRRIHSAYIRRPNRPDRPTVFSPCDKKTRNLRVKSAGCGSSSNQRTAVSSVRSKDDDDNVASASSSRTDIMGQTQSSRPPSSPLENACNGSNDKIPDEQDDVFVSQIPIVLDNTIPKENRETADPSQLPDKHDNSSNNNNNNFMRAAVMVTLTTKDIVKKAKAAVKKKGLDTLSMDTRTSDTDGRWYTSIHEEHDRLTSDIARDKQRTANIRSYLDARAKQKQRRTNEHPDDYNNYDTINTGNNIRSNTSMTSLLSSGKNERHLNCTKQIMLSGPNEELNVESIDFGPAVHPGGEITVKTINSIKEETTKTHDIQADTVRLESSYHSLQSNLVQEVQKGYDSDSDTDGVKPNLNKEKTRCIIPRRDITHLEEYSSSSQPNLVLKVQTKYNNSDTLPGMICSGKPNLMTETTHDLIERDITTHLESPRCSPSNLVQKVQTTHNNSDTLTDMIICGGKPNLKEKTHDIIERDAVTHLEESSSCSQPNLVQKMQTRIDLDTTETDLNNSGVKSNHITVERNKRGEYNRRQITSKVSFMETQTNETSQDDHVTSSVFQLNSYPSHRDNHSRPVSSKTSSTRGSDPACNTRTLRPSSAPVRPVTFLQNSNRVKGRTRDCMVTIRDLQ